MKRLLPLISVFCLIGSAILISPKASGLVTPFDSQIEKADWLATISIRSDFSGKSYNICSGVLIEPLWVLSSKSCVVDPFESIYRVSRSGKVTYYVTLHGQAEKFEVVESIESDDGRLVLHRLNQPAVAIPIVRSTLESHQLIDMNVELPGLYESDNIGNYFFNPNGIGDFHCRLGDQYFLLDGALCYILSPVYKLPDVHSIFGRVIDREFSGPLTSPLDDSFSGGFEESVISIDFDNNSFPCYEDLGSPVVANIDGETQLIGIVEGVGIASALPLCTNSLYNYYYVSASYENFIQETLVREPFHLDCPATTRLSVEEKPGNVIRLSWEAQLSATGYRILYTPRPGYEPIQSIELGNVTEVSSSVDPDTMYSVSLLAYNESCTSQPSNTVTILLNKP